MFSQLYTAEVPSPNITLQLVETNSVAKCDVPETEMVDMMIINKLGFARVKLPFQSCRSCRPHLIG